MNEVSSLLQATKPVYLDARHEGFMPGETSLGNSFFTLKLPPSDDTRSMFLIFGGGPILFYLMILFRYLPVPPEGVERITLILNPLACIGPWTLFLYVVYRNLKKPGPVFGVRKQLEIESRWLVGKLLEFEPYSPKRRAAQLAYRFETPAGRSIIAEQNIYIGLPGYVKRLLIPGATVGVLYGDDQTHRILWVAEDTDAVTEWPRKDAAVYKLGQTGITGEMASTGGWQALITAIGWILLAIISIGALLPYIPKAFFLLPLTLETVFAWMMIVGPMLFAIGYFSVAMKHYRYDRDRLKKLRDSRTLLDAKIVSMKGIMRHLDRYSIEPALIVAWEALSPNGKPMSGSWTQSENHTQEPRPGSYIKILYADDETYIPLV